jgi:hypothetical protein
MLHSCSKKALEKSPVALKNRPTNTRALAWGRRRQLTARALERGWGRWRERRWGWRQLLTKPSLALRFVAWWVKIREDQKVWGRSLEEEEFTQNLQEVGWRG